MFITGARSPEVPLLVQGHSKDVVFTRDESFLSGVKPEFLSSVLYYIPDWVVSNILDTVNPNRILLSKLDWPARLARPLWGAVPETNIYAIFVFIFCEHAISGTYINMYLHTTKAVCASAIFTWFSMCIKPVKLQSVITSTFYLPDWKAAFIFRYSNRYRLKFYYSV